MTDDAYKDLILHHDKQIGQLSLNIDSLSRNIESVVREVGETNKKINDIVVVLNKQNIIFERLNNIDNNAKESFVRLHKRIDTIEQNQNVTGCSMLQQTNERLKVANKRIFDLETSRSWIVKTIIGTLITGGFGVLLVFTKGT